MGHEAKTMLVGRDQGGHLASVSGGPEAGDSPASGPPGSARLRAVPLTTRALVRIYQSEGGRFDGYDQRWVCIDGYTWRVTVDGRSRSGWRETLKDAQRAAYEAGQVLTAAIVEAHEERLKRRGKSR